MVLLDIEFAQLRERSFQSTEPSALEAETRTLDLDRLIELEDFLVRLDRDSRCRRFGHAASDDVLKAHAARALADAACVFGIYAGGDLRGVLEVYSCAPAPCAEVALVVEPLWRRRGLGWSLLGAATRWADDAGEQGLQLIFTRDNWPMRKLTAKAGAAFDMALGEIRAEIAPSRLRQQA